MTDEQLKIFTLICGGFTSKEIGERISMNFRTVEKKIGEMLGEFHCKNVPQLVYNIMSRPKLFRMTADEIQQYCEREYKMSEIM